MLGLTLFCSNTFLFHSHRCLALYSIMSFLTKAFGDAAFEAPDLTTPERLYGLKVEPGLKQRRVIWKESGFELPIFRDQEGKPLRYAEQLRNLGKATNFKEVLTTYCLRRGAANSIDGMCFTVKG